MSTGQKEPVNENLDKLISDNELSKYKVTVMASQWVRHLRKQEAYKNLPMSEVLEIALKDIITGRITNEKIREVQLKDMVNIEKLLVKVEEAPKKEKKKKAKSKKK